MYVISASATSKITRNGKEARKSCVIGALEAQAAEKQVKAEGHRKYKTTFPVAPPPAPSYTRLSPAPPDASLTPRRAAGRVPCRPHAGRRTADAPVMPGAG